MPMTMQQHFPSLRALQGHDERLLADELRLVATKQQLAVVRTLADELERCLSHGDPAPALHEQFAQELARLGCRSLETAAAMAGKPVDATEQSGTHRTLTVADG